MTPVNLHCLLFSLLQDMKKEKFLDVDCPVHDIYVSMLLSFRLRFLFHGNQLPPPPQRRRQQPHQQWEEEDGEEVEEE